MPCSKMMSWQQRKEWWLVPPPTTGVREKQRAREVDIVEMSSKPRKVGSRFTLSDTGSRNLRVQTLTTRK